MAQMMNKICAPRRGGAIPPAFAVAKLQNETMRNEDATRSQLRGLKMLKTYRGIGRPAGTGVIGGG